VAQDTTEVILPSIYNLDMRVLMIFSPDDGGLYQEQIQEMAEHVEGIDERDLVLYSIFAAEGINPENEPLNQAHVVELRQQFGVGENDFVVVLIGKDGTEKLRETGFLNAETLFSIIDAMPMRQEEIRNR
jgi:hypothetical protein